MYKRQAVGLLHTAMKHVARELPGFQVPNNTLHAFTIIAEYQGGMIAEGTKPISYTHLDVYKRQVHPLLQLSQTTDAAYKVNTLVGTEVFDAKHFIQDRKSTRLNSSHRSLSRMPSSA